MSSINTTSQALNVTSTDTYFNIDDSPMHRMWIDDMTIRIIILFRSQNFRT